MTVTIEQIASVNRNVTLTPWFHKQLTTLLSLGVYTQNADTLVNHIVHELQVYKTRTKTYTVVVGISGGIDSAVVAALFKRAGYRVMGLVLPIHQNPDETARGIEVCSTLGIECIQYDLSDLYDGFVSQYAATTNMLIYEKNSIGAIRRGNIKARLRMISLYDQAKVHGGFVASTDNLSELGLGFWTLHGDVGDVGPIQSLTKSWEVPLLAKELGIPTSVLDAIPTDGLGISASDEAQIGISYLEFDIVLLSLLHSTIEYPLDSESLDKIAIAKDRIRNSCIKRANPYNIAHPVFSARLDTINRIQV